MLRITVEDHENALAIRVEGKLRGPWVAELEHCWKGARHQADGKPIRADLTNVSFVDDAAKSLLGRMLQDGVELDATGPMMPHIVAEIAADLGSGRKPRVPAVRQPGNASKVV